MVLNSINTYMKSVVWTALTYKFQHRAGAKISSCIVSVLMFLKAFKTIILEDLSVSLKSTLILNNSKTFSLSASRRKTVHEYWSIKSALLTVINVYLSLENYK